MHGETVKNITEFVTRHSSYIYFRMRDVNSTYFVSQFRIPLYTSRSHGIWYQKNFVILNIVQVVTF